MHGSMGVTTTPRCFLSRTASPSEISWMPPTRTQGLRSLRSATAEPYKIGPIMKFARILLTVALFNALNVTQAMADCQIADAKLEEAILQKPELRGPTHRQSVR